MSWKDKKLKELEKRTRVKLIPKPEEKKPPSTTPTSITTPTAPITKPTSVGDMLEHVLGVSPSLRSRVIEALEEELRGREELIKRREELKSKIERIEEEIIELKEHKKTLEEELKSIERELSSYDILEKLCHKLREGYRGA